MIINLFPPQIDTWMPAFIYTEACKIYFSISQYNNLSDIQGIQLTVVDPNTNKTKLDTSKYPLSIKQYLLSDIITDTSKTTSDKYYISLSPDDIQDGTFVIDSYYKIQLRFISNKASIIDDTSLTYAWLNKNANYLSEWSTSCLLLPISDFTVKVSSFVGGRQQNSFISVSPAFSSLIASATFDDETESEAIKKYQIKVYDSNSVLYIDSGMQESTNNIINYIFKKDFKYNSNYTINASIYTTNGYEKDCVWKIKILDYSTQDSVLQECTITALPDNDNARMQVTFARDDGNLPTGTFVIRRADNKDGFETMEDIQYLTITKAISSKIWYDYTVENGVQYIYNIAEEYNGIRTSVISSLISGTEAIPAIMDISDSFLVNEDLQINIKFNKEINSVKNNKSENKVETLGSKYPFIRTDSNLFYQSFQISGLISSFWAKSVDMNLAEVLTQDSLSRKDNKYSTTIDDSLLSKLTQSNIYTNNNKYANVDIYFSKYQENKIASSNYVNNCYSVYNDYIFEKYFREKIMNYLCDNTPKLFKSRSLGNHIVKIMEVSFSPQSGDEFLYGFQATAYEIADTTIENYDIYNIQPLDGTIEDEDGLISSYKFSQLENFECKASNNIITDIAAQAKENNMNLNSISSIFIEINKDETQPYYIGIKNGVPSVITNEEDSYDNIIKGYLVYIDEKPFIINEEGLLSLGNEENSNYEIESIIFAKDTIASINYNGIISETDSEEAGILNTNIETICGQKILYLSPKKESSIYNLLIDTYQFELDDENKYISSIDYLSVSAVPSSTKITFYQDNQGIYSEYINAFGIKEIDMSEEIFSGNTVSTTNDITLTNISSSEIEIEINYILTINSEAVESGE